MTPEFLTPEDAASVLGVSKATIYRRIAAGDLPALRLGEYKGAPVRIDPRDLLAWARACGQARRYETAVLP